MTDRKLSEDGLRMLTNFEGTVLHRYVDQAGVVTIGTGHALTLDEMESGAYAGGISAEAAKELLRSDVGKAERAVSELITVPLEQFQFDALVSFTFNLGRGALQMSSLRLKLNGGDYDSVPAELERWCKRKDPKTGQLVVDAGLLGRRKAEGSVWANGYSADVQKAAAAAFSHNFTTRELLEGKDDGGKEEV